MAHAEQPELIGLLGVSGVSQPCWMKSSFRRWKLYPQRAALALQNRQHSGEYFPVAGIPFATGRPDPDYGRPGNMTGQLLADEEELAKR